MKNYDNELKDALENQNCGRPVFVTDNSLVKKIEWLEIENRNREVIADLQRKRIVELETRMTKLDGEERTTYMQRLEAEKLAK